MTHAQRTNARQDAIWERARAQGHTTFNAEADAAAAKALAAPGNPKSAPAPVHTSMTMDDYRAMGKWNKSGNRVIGGRVMTRGGRFQ